MVCPSILSNRVLCDLIRHVAGKMAEVAVAVWIKSPRRHPRRAPGLEPLSKDRGLGRAGKLRENRHGMLVIEAASSIAPRSVMGVIGWRTAAGLLACAVNRKSSPWLVAGFVALHVVLWTVILTRLRAAQEIHFDVAEAFAWGQKFLLGYGKHPPLSGWVAGAWFMLFPVTDWSTYALAMVTVGVGMMICWAIALRVVDRRRAFLVVAMLAIYPIFNLKGFKYNADLLQLVTLPLLILAYLDAFEKRTVRSGAWLGLAGALALMTKYWVLTMMGAIGLAALIHPARLVFLRSPAPWIAIATLAVVMLPHFIWLMQVDFLPLTYASETYSLTGRVESAKLVLGYIGHNVALLALPLTVTALALAWGPPGHRLLRRDPLAFVAGAWSHDTNVNVRTQQAWNIWIVQIIVAIGPPIGALAFSIYLKTDWGISLFFLTPLAMIAIPQLRVRQAALVRAAATWLVISLTVLAAAPLIVPVTMRLNAAGQSTYGSHSELARDLTELWHRRFHSSWKVVVGSTDVSDPITFYSPDHPAPLAPSEVWSYELTPLDEAKRNGFIGVCEVDAWNQQECEAWMRQNTAGGDEMTLTTRRVFHGSATPTTAWHVYVVPADRG
jgi:4-amino-4-deoxy-L-arabinose transferase-like glycosyltransferase